jgi:TPP-dependent pyruvate/acetoin dehydrogenase alpha subunit
MRSATRAGNPRRHLRQKRKQGMEVKNAIGNEELLQMYRRMVSIRAFEETLSGLFSKGLLGGTSHFCIGQESCAVGVISAARDEDWLVSNHRGHGHLLARGLDIARVMGELMGKLNGYCGGRGGSQHLCAMDRCFLGTNGITGGGIPIATGAALALKYRKSENVAIAFFGDGASNQGTFHESLNMASLWKLPVLFVCENNLYGMSNPVSKSCASGTIAVRAPAYAMRGECHDGFDVELVHRVAGAALERVRSGEGPELLELMTYRQCGHSKNDARVYRSREEEAEMAKRDCLLLTAASLRQRGFSQADIDAADATARQEVAQAAEIAQAAPTGGREHALSGLFA